MSARLGLAVIGASVTLTFLGGAAAVAQPADYTGTQDTGTQDTGVLSGTATRDTGTSAVVPTPRVSPSTLPFTGGELILIAVAGTAAVATGVGMTAGGRRRADAAH